MNAKRFEKTHADTCSFLEQIADAGSIELINQARINMQIKYG